MPKYVYINFQIWFPKYKFNYSKYIKNVEVHSLRTPVLELSQAGRVKFDMRPKKFSARLLREKWGATILKVSDKGGFLFPASGVISRALLNCWKLSLPFQVKSHCLEW